MSAKLEKAKVLMNRDSDAQKEFDLEDRKLIRRPREGEGEKRQVKREAQKLEVRVREREREKEQNKD